MGEEIKAKFNFVNREPINALFNIVENEPIKAIFKIDPPSLNYNLLYNKPQINSVELIGNKSLSDLGIIQAITDNINLHNNSQEAHPYIQGLITAEAETRATADTALGTRITEETNARTAGDIALQTSLTNETNTRISEDALIRNSIKDGKLYIQKNGITVATFSANQAGDTTANILADNPVWGNITGNIHNQTDLQQALDSKVPTSRKINGQPLTQDITIDTLPSQAGHAGEFLTTNGTSPSWAEIPTETDDITINLNSDDELQAIGVIDSRDNTSALKTWTGTKAQYDAIITKDANTLYNVEDDGESISWDISWGAITGDIADQTDLQTQFNTKQATLVSGTNIKTINNQSILGSGNIEIQGGGIGNLDGGTATSVYTIDQVIDGGGASGNAA